LIQKFYFAIEVCVQRLLSPLLRISLTSAIVLFGASLELRANESLPIPENEYVLVRIAQSDYWKKLLHYKNNLLSAGIESDITDPAFFVSEYGRTDALRELSATVMAFKKDHNSVCRFPARYYWLSQKYGGVIGLQPGLLAQCADLQEWRKKINPGSATLIFPAAYLNGPSSMFGHTLLRVEPDDERKDLPLITYAVNYAANVTQRDNNVAFAFNGIFGGYPGVMAIVPYHEKIKEYGEIENRDIWEYKLKLNKDEILQMMRHAWELKDLRSAYYFFDLNCSYLILNLIETAREGIDLTVQFRFKVIPIDTVRAVVDAGLVLDTVYRPAAATVLAQHYALLEDNQRSQVQHILKTQMDPTLVKKNQSDIAYARLLEVTYDTLRYQAFQTPSERDRNAAYNLKLLKERSQLNVKAIWPDIKEPDFKPELGHRSGRMAIGYRRSSVGDEDKDYAMLKVRPAYHDLLDPAKGFPVGAQINFLDFTFAYNTDEHEGDLERLTIIDILSLTPMHDLFDPLSWRVDFGYEKRSITGKEINILQVSPGFGKTKTLFEEALGYALLNSTLEYSPDYEDDYSLGVGVQAGMLLTANKYSVMLELKSTRMFSGQKDTRFTALLGFAQHLSTNLSLRVTVDREKMYEQYANNYQLSLNWYF